MKDYRKILDHAEDYFNRKKVLPFSFLDNLITILAERIQSNDEIQLRLLNEKLSQNYKSYLLESSTTVAKDLLGGIGSENGKAIEPLPNEVEAFYVGVFWAASQLLYQAENNIMDNRYPLASRFKNLFKFWRNK